jgi:uncharacterized membrane protein
MNFLTAIFITVGVLAGMALSAIYVAVIHDPHVIATTREGYVELAEKDAAEAKTAEVRRQLNAASLSLTEMSKRQQADEMAQHAQQAQNDLDIADYEKRLQAANRACTVDSDDSAFILHH